MPMAETALVVLQLSALVRREKESWLAGCPSLDVYTQGETADEAKANLREAVELWIDSCIERNTLGKALQELGWFRVPPGTSAPVGIDTIEVLREGTESLGEEFPLEVTIPAYQAALFSGSDDRASR